MNSAPSLPCSIASADRRQPFPYVIPVEYERGRYWVQSRSNGGIPYLVDLEEFSGNGWCGCPGFLHYIESLENGG